MEQRNQLKKSLTYLLIPILSLLTFVLICSPLRVAIIDDDFATVREVKHYLVSGHYIQSNWTAPFTFPQVIYGAKISQILGSLIPIEIALRLSTLFFSSVGIISLFLLARQSGLNLKASSVCCLQIIASSIYTYLSYLFYSDIPFLSMALLSVALYTHGFSKNKWQFTLTASIFASASVLIRQIGLTIPLSLILFLAFSKNKKSNFIPFILGFILPFACTFYVIKVQSSALTFAGILHNQAQSEYLHSLKSVLFGSIERMSLLPIIMTLFATPLSFIGAIYAIYTCYLYYLKNKRFSKIRVIHSFFPLFLSFSLISIVVFKRLLNHDSLFLPYLPWYYDYNFLSIAGNAVFSLIILFSSILLVFLFIRNENSCKLQPNYKLSQIIKNLQKLSFFDWFSICNLFLLMFIFKTGDKYFITILPWFLIWICSVLHRCIEKYFIPIVAMLIIVTIGNAAVLDRSYSQMEAEFKSVKLLENSGISRQDIWYSMAGYDSFESYVKEIGFTPPNMDKGMYYDFFFRWCPEKQKQAIYEIVRTNDSNSSLSVKGKVINEIKIKDWRGKITRILTILKL
jgi:hypothetical protein